MFIHNFFFYCNSNYCHRGGGWDPVLGFLFYRWIPAFRLRQRLRRDKSRLPAIAKSVGGRMTKEKVNALFVRLFRSSFPFLLLTMGAAHCYKLGIEAIPKQLKQQYAHTTARIGLVTNHTGTDQQGTRTVDILLNQGFGITKLFVPEHGLDGKVLAGLAVADTQDKTTKLPVISLYEHGAGKDISPQLFADIDLLMFDMQDVGMRHYTYISTLYKVLEAAANYNKKVIIFDRPNPLGDCMEGPLCATNLHSFIGICSIPLRHGMTIGELAQLFNTKMLRQPADIAIVPLQDFTRTANMERLPTHLSPNIANLHAAHGYSFLGLLGEVAPFDVGVGTQRAFQVITLPLEHAPEEPEWRRLQQQLMQYSIASRPYTYFNACKKKEYHGLALQINDIAHVPAFKVFLAVLQWAKDIGLAVTFAPVFDKSVGSDKIRAWFNGRITRDELLARIDDELQLFLQEHKDMLLYPESPRIVQQRLLSINTNC
jgi:uncharacterized protein YbbC (DUF1343 family)